MYIYVYMHMYVYISGLPEAQAAGERLAIEREGIERWVEVLNR